MIVDRIPALSGMLATLSYRVDLQIRQTLGEISQRAQLFDFAISQREIRSFRGSLRGAPRVLLLQIWRDHNSFSVHVTRCGLVTMLSI